MHPDDKKTGTPDEESIFLAAIDIEDPQLRKVYLDEACQSDPVLLKRVEALLKAYEESGAFLKIAGITNSAGNTRNDTDAEPGASSARAGELTSIDSTSSQERLDLSILTPSTKPGSLGRLLHYEIEEVLGSGGCGTVFRAFDEKLHRRVALKLMAPELAVTSPARKRFLREARASAAIRHDNVVQIYAVEEQPLPFIVMEYIAGKTLQQMHEEKGPFSIDEVVDVGQQIASGLAAAHATGLIHRDIKPGNILVEDGTHRVKITDFGLARTADDASITQSGVIAGTPLYMSPEQARGEPLDYRSDLFSLGSVLYVLCTGRPPFRAANTMAVLKRVVEDTPRDMHDIVPEIPVWLIDIVEKLHAKDREARFESATEVAARLNLRDKAPHLSESELRNGDAKPRNSQAEKPASKQEPATTVFLAGSHSFSSSFSNWASRPLGLAALVLFAILLGFGMTEAAGVTAVTKTVIRLFTPTGTLVVEVDDPNISLRIDGQEIVVTGAGVKELRLQPGQYEVEAREGDALILKQLVNISSHGREILKISQEGTRKPAQATATMGQSSAGSGLYKDRSATIRKGNWTAEGNEVVLSSTFESHVSFGNPEWTDIDFSYETLTTSNAADSQGGIGLFRLLDFNNALSFPLGAYGGRAIELNRVIEGKWSRDNDGGYLNFAFERQRWYQVKLQLRGDKTTCFLDGAQVLTMADPHRLQGKVGFASWNAAVRFRNIRVTDPQGNLLWEGAPDLPQASPAAPIPATSKTVDPAAPVLTMQHIDPVRWVAFSKDGSRIVSASNGDDHEIRGGVRYHVAGKDNTVRIWDAQTGKEIRRLRMTEGSHYGPLGIAISPDGTSLAASSGWATANGPSEPRVYVWNMETGERLHHFPLADNHCVRCVAFSPQGSVVKLARSGKGGINSWTLPEGKELPRVVFQDTPPGVEAPRMSFSPDANYLLSAVWNGAGEIRAWKTDAGEIAKTFQGHTRPPTHVMMSANGQLLLACAPDFTIRLWDWASERQLLCIGDDEILDSQPRCVAFSPDGSSFVVGDDSGQVSLYDTRSGSILERFTGHTARVNDVGFSADGKRLVSGSDDRTVRIWPLSDHPLADRLMTENVNPSAGSDHAATRYVLNQQGSVWINGESTARQSLSVAEFANSVQLTGIEFRNRRDLDAKDFEVFSGCRDLEKVRLGFSSITDAHLKPLEDLPKLTHLELSQCEKVTGAAIRKFKHLTHLEAWAVPVGDDDLAPLKDNPFRNLDLGGTRITGKALAAFTNLSDLRSSRLAFTSIKNKDLAALKDCHRLTFLALYNTGIGDEGVREICELKALRSLELQGSKVTNEVFFYLMKLPHLLSVDLRYTQVTPEAIESFRKQKPLCEVKCDAGVLPRLEPNGDELVKNAKADRAAAAFVLKQGKYVWLDNAKDPLHGDPAILPPHLFKLTGISLDGLKTLTPRDFEIFKGCQNLSDLQLLNMGITDEHLRAFEGTTSITKLKLDGQAVTSKGLSYFSGCQRLTSLSVWATQADDKFIQSIASPDYTYLNLGGTRITDASIAAFGSLQNLEMATLNFTGLTDEGVADLATAENLTYLGLNHTRLTDASAKVFLKLHQLEELALSNTQFSDLGLSLLVNALPNLKRLNLLETKVTAYSVDKFQSKHPNCRILWNGGEFKDFN